MVLERLINLSYGTQAISTSSIKTLNVLEIVNKTSLKLSTLSEKTETVFCLIQLVWDDVVTLEADAPTWHFLVCLYQVLLYLQRCLEHAAGVTEEDRVKNCILPSVARYVKKLLMGPDSEGACDHFNLLLENVTFGINRVEEKQTRLNKEATCSLWEKSKSIFAKRVVPSRY